MAQKQPDSHATQGQATATMELAKRLIAESEVLERRERQLLECGHALHILSKTGPAAEGVDACVQPAQPGGRSCPMPPPFAVRPGQRGCSDTQLLARTPHVAAANTRRSMTFAPPGSATNASCFAKHSPSPGPPCTPNLEAVRDGKVISSTARSTAYQDRHAAVPMTFTHSQRAVSFADDACPKAAAAGQQSKVHMQEGVVNHPQLQPPHRHKHRTHAVEDPSLAVPLTPLPGQNVYGGHGSSCATPDLDIARWNQQLAREQGPLDCSDLALHAPRLPSAGHQPQERPRRGRVPPLETASLTKHSQRPAPAPAPSAALHRASVQWASAGKRGRHTADADAGWIMNGHHSVLRRPVNSRLSSVAGRCEGGGDGGGDTSRTLLTDRSASCELPLSGRQQQAAHARVLFQTPDVQKPRISPPQPHDVSWTVGLETAGRGVAATENSLVRPGEGSVHPGKAAVPVADRTHEAPTYTNVAAGMGKLSNVVIDKQDAELANACAWQWHVSVDQSPCMQDTSPSVLAFPSDFVDGLPFMERRLPTHQSHSPEQGGNGMGALQGTPRGDSQKGSTLRPQCPEVTPSESYWTWGAGEPERGDRRMVIMKELVSMSPQPWPVADVTRTQRTG